MNQAVACFNDHRYVHLGEADPLDLVKVYDVVQHNNIIQGELRDLDRLCALREQPFFSREEMRNTTEAPTVLHEDPRGWRPIFDWETDVPPRPQDYCPHCHCTIPNCVDKQFGLYMQLRVVQEVNSAYHKATIGAMVEEDIANVLRKGYNEYLRIRLFESRRLLDSFSDYCLPKCIVDGAGYNTAMRYFASKQYDFLMESRIVFTQDN
jgi:hypothetical protein